MKNSTGCSIGEPSEQEEQFVTFDMDDIINGTNNFKSIVLGEGSFGRVYECHLPKYNIVGAAKIQEHPDFESQMEFKAEIATLQRAKHLNVIRLLGKSVFTNGTLCLVYEFMPNSSLHHHLFDDKDGPGLNWNKRINIALGVAEGLSYLHNGLQVIHRDIKSSNILLDNDFVPKLADFGLASRIFHGENGDEIVRKVIPNKGTPGFLAPERLGGLVSTKSDVYSFGVFLFELFTGKKGYDSKRPYASWYLTDWLTSVGYSDDNMDRVIDGRLGNNYPVEGLRRVFEVANLCIKTDGNERPNMITVVDKIRQASA